LKNWQKRGIVMGNVMDYLEWRGDLTFEQSPFNDVDNVILAQLAYVDFRDVIPSVQMNRGITLKKASEIFFDLHTEEELSRDKSFIKDAPYLMKKAASTKRFKDVILSDYVDTIDETLEKQFGAFHIKLTPQLTYVAFRGTDDTLVGWKEDFNMSFISPVPSQEDAVKYLNATCSYIRGRLYVGGHSKGGNLAIYSAINCNKRVKKKIKCVYNNDGPGFDISVIKSEEYQSMLPYIRSIVPENSIVGMLLEHDDDYIIVKSSQTGIMQHDAMSWQVSGPYMVTVRRLSAQSRRLNRAFSSWISSVDNEKRCEFVETLFGLISSCGVKNLSDISVDRFKSTREVIKQYANLDKDSRTLLRSMLLSLTDQIGKARLEK
jgi:hypothetical protein